ncbi:MAG: lanthionine synthetase LanC family protein [Pseudonocardiaceae bacterium]
MNGLVWTGTADSDQVDPTLYSGAAGIVIALLEAHRHFGDDQFADAAVRGGRAIAAGVDEVGDCSLYSGLAGMAVALRTVDDLLGDVAAGTAADHALEAGVLALACDRHAERRDNLEFATMLVDDLASRATVDGDEVRWSNHEYRVTPSALEPRTGWAMGNAGIIRELLRFARATAGTNPSYAVTWPDHPAVGHVADTSVRPPLG